MKPRLTAVAALLALGACNTADINPMERQGKYLPYQYSEFYADGRAMRHPPQGTVPRERDVSNPMIDVAQNPDGSWVTQIPVPVTMEMLQAGRKRYEITCGTCHGIAGDGDSLVAQNMAQRPAPSFFEIDTTPGRVYAALRDGFGLMPPFAAEIERNERWAVVAYIQALKASGSVPLAELPSDVQQQLMKEKP